MVGHYHKNILDYFRRRSKNICKPITRLCIENVGKVSGRENKALKGFKLPKTEVQVGMQWGFCICFLKLSRKKVSALYFIKIESAFIQCKILPE